LYVLEDIEEGLTKYITDTFEDSEAKTTFLTALKKFFEDEWAKFKKNSSGEYDI